jgi:hypothetical protein
MRFAVRRNGDYVLAKQTNYGRPNSRARARKGAVIRQLVDDFRDLTWISR